MGTETIAEAQQQLKRICTDSSFPSRLENFDRNNFPLPWKNRFPAVHCALESAWCDLQAKQTQQPLNRWLSKNAAAQVQVNLAGGTLASFQPVQIPQQIAQWEKSDVSVVKLKIGVASPATELEMLQNLLAALPTTMKIRLDTNQAWDFATAQQFLSNFKNPPCPSFTKGGNFHAISSQIDALEEPIKTPALAQLSELQKQITFPIALDESLSNFLAQFPSTEVFAKQLQQHHLRRVVLKPMLLGGPLTTFRLAKTLQDFGIETVVTSALESNIGLLSAAHCAASIDPKNQWKHGLDTANHLIKNLAVAPRIKNGILSFPKIPGLGIHILPNEP